MSPRLKIAIVLIVSALIIVGLALLSGSIKKKPVKNSVLITNLNSCAKDINSKVEATLGTQIYSYVKTANDYNHRANQSSYSAQIRQGSCQQLASTTSANNTVSSTSATLDIPAAKQSWKITWAWITKDQTLATDVGSVEMECLPTDQLTYGDFHCTNTLSIIQYGTPHYDPILKFVPYSGDTFDVAYSPADKVVTVTVLVPAVWASDPTVAQNIEGAVPGWFSQNGLDINNYTVNYVVSSKP